MQIKSKVWIEDEEGTLIFGEGKTKLLEHIQDVKSISKAAKMAGMSYKKAWTHINIVEEKIAQEIVQRTKGGKGGGGTILTPKGEELVKRFNHFKAEIDRFANEKFHEMFLDDNSIIDAQKEQ